MLSSSQSYLQLTKADGVIFVVQVVVCPSFQLSYLLFIVDLLDVQFFFDL